MADDSTASEGNDSLSPKVRKRLEDLFKFGEDKRNAGDHDYAHSMYSQCVAKDPSNLKYVETMLSNLSTKWAGKKGKLRVKESRSEFKKALSDEDWKTVFKSGASLLKDNPWDVPTLRSLADACKANRYNEIELQYLKYALDANPRDIEVNKHCATSLARMGQFDQAIACWARIEEKLQKESRTKISELTMAKNRRAAGITDEGEEIAAARPVAKEEPKPSDSEAESKSSAPVSGTPSTPEPPATVEGLEEAIVKNPEEVDNYVALADLHYENADYRDAEQVLRRALPVSGGSLNIVERLEKTQLKRSRAYVDEAKAKAQSSPSDETKKKLASARRQNLRAELDVYAARAERYPDEIRLKYEVGSRMKKLGNYEEAVPYFTAAQADPKTAVAAYVSAGECLQQMKQYTAALKSYEEAVSRAGDATDEVAQLALYRAGTLAIGLKDAERGKNWLEKLVNMAPSYKDAAARLDKLS